MKNTELKVLVIGREPHSRGLVVDTLEEIEGLRVVSTATSGSVAIARLNRSDADMVILDMEIGEDEALDVLSGIHQKFPGTATVAMGDSKSRAPEKMVKALEMGAVDFIEKPTEDPMDLKDFKRQCRVLAGMLQNRMSFRQSQNVSANTHKDSKTPQPSERNHKSSPHRELHPRKGSSTVLARKKEFRSPRIDAVVIGISTGGPNALLAFIPSLKADLGVPVFLVQHMPKQFTATLAESLNKRSSLMVKEAKHDEIILPDTVYVAPGGRHMVVSRKLEEISAGRGARIVLNDDPPVNSCRPSADVLFSSVARAYGRHVLAVVMTGMGNDGMQGTREVVEKGGYCISQSDDTCVVYGMPRAVKEVGLSSESVPLGRMAQRVMRLVRGERGQRA
jgi:two-component system chemotaxis response regulator CheB